MTSHIKKFLSLFALCIIIALGFVDPADAAPQGPPSVECRLNGGVWHPGEDLDPEVEEGECVFEETTTTVTAPEPTTTAPPTTTEQTTTVPDSLIPPFSVSRPTPPPSTPELARTGAGRDSLLRLSIMAEAAIATGGSVLIMEQLARRKVR